MRGGVKLPSAGEWGGLQLRGRPLGLGFMWPSQVLDFMQMWSPYVEATVASLKACAAATSDAKLSAQTATNARWLESLWHAYDNYDGFDFTNNAPTILGNLQQALYAAGLYTQQATASGQCTQITWPAPAPLPHQSAVISALQDARIVTVGELELLAAGAGGVLVAAGTVARSAGQAVSGLAGILATPWPWAAIAVVAGAVIAVEVWPRGR